MDGENVQFLIKFQDILINQLNDVGVNIEATLAENRPYGFYEKRIQALSKIYDTFLQNHYAICQNDDANSTTEYVDKHKFREFEKKYFDIISKLEQKCPSHPRTHANNSPDLSSTHITTLVSPSRTNVQLPRIALPKFDGTYKSWRAFRDLYIDLIHKNNEISDIAKLHYLKSCVSDEAERVIRPFEITGANYSKAWEALEKRFNNNRVLINSQLARLCRITPVKSECAQAMKDVLSNTEETLHELKTLNVNTENWDPLIVYLTLQKLAPETRELWETEQSKKTEVATFKELTEFLEARFRVLESINKSTKSKVFLNQNNRGSNHVRNCPKCNSDHRLFHCENFKKLSAYEKLKLVKEKYLCMNCLAPGHRFSKCTSKHTCNFCKQKHHTLLHASLNSKSGSKQTLISAQLKNSDTGDQTPPFTKGTEENLSRNFFSSHVNQALLSTALVNVRNAQGQIEKLRALIDSGSQATFITAAAAKRLKLSCTRAKQVISGLNQSSSTMANSQTEFTLESVYGTFKRKVNALVIKTITNYLPTEQIETAAFNHLENLTLADPKFAIPGRIDLLLGAEIYADIIREGIIRSVEPNQPVAVNTALGWIVMGNVGLATRSSKAFMVHIHESDCLDEQIRRFWTQEEIQDTAPDNPDDVKCEEIFQNTTKRLPDGTYQVDLPFKLQNGPHLGESRQKAVSQFLSLERKFSQSKEYYELYKKNMEEYLTAGHMVQTDSQVNKRITYYLPHHRVLKESTTTKLRTVFNASSTSSNGLSLNKQMFTGTIMKPASDHFIHDVKSPASDRLVARRNRFSLINAKNTTRFQSHKRIRCFKTKPTEHTQLMHELPTARVTPSFPFQHVGIDFAGPIDMKISSLRTAKITPVYICLFICFSTKAVHLELVSDLSADSFIASFQRFTSRRGLCSDIYSDCGTNFVKANKIMFSKETQEQIANKLAIERIKWHFNPPSAPHFGGLWESHVKIVKRHLKCTLQNTKLTFESLYTVLCKIEACINSRPLIPVGSDPDSDTFITPGHFLVHRNLQHIPEKAEEENKVPTRKLQFFKQLQQNFWNRWSKDYLHNLQMRTKWKSTQQNLNVNDIVLIKRENFPPLSWPLGRIIEIYPGKDGLIRAALIKIGYKTYLRPIVKLCKLPIENGSLELSQ